MIKATFRDASDPFEFYQGEDKALPITSNIDLTAYTEIEFVIGTDREIRKSLSAGEISNVTANGFTVQIDASDTESTKEGEYLFQVRGTDSSGKINHGTFHPNKVVIKPSVFVNRTNGSDYGQS